MLKLTSAFSAIKPFINSSLTNINSSLTRVGESGKSYAHRLNESRKHYTGRLRESGKHYVNQLKQYVSRVGAAGKHYANRVSTSGQQYAHRLNDSRKHYTGRLKESGKHYAHQLKQRANNLGASVKHYANRVSTSSKQYAHRLNESGKHYIGRLRDSGKHYANRLNASGKHYAARLKQYTNELSHFYHTKVGHIEHNLREKVITRMLPTGMHTPKLKTWMHSILKMATYNEKKFEKALNSHLPKIKRFGEPEAVARLLTELYVLLLANGEEKTQPQRKHLVAQFNTLVGRDFKLLPDNAFDKPIDEKLIHSPFIAELTNEGTAIQLPSAKLMTVLALAGMTPIAAWALRRATTASAPDTQPSGTSKPANVPATTHANPATAVNTNAPVSASTSTPILPEHLQPPATNTFEPPFVPISTAPDVNPLLHVTSDDKSPRANPEIVLEDPSSTTPNTFTNLYQTLFTAAEEKTSTPTVAETQDAIPPVKEDVNTQEPTSPPVTSEVNTDEEADVNQGTSTSSATNGETLTPNDAPASPEQTTPKEAASNPPEQAPILPPTSPEADDVKGTQANAGASSSPTGESINQQEHDGTPSLAPTNSDVVGGSIPATANAADEVGPTPGLSTSSNKPTTTSKGTFSSFVNFFSQTSAANAEAPEPSTPVNALLTAPSETAGNKFDLKSQDPVIIQAMLESTRQGDASSSDASQVNTQSTHVELKTPSIKRVTDVRYEIVRKCFEEQLDSDFMKEFYPHKSVSQLSEEQQQAVRHVCEENLAHIYQTENRARYRNIAIAVTTIVALALGVHYRNSIRNAFESAKQLCKKRIMQISKPAKTPVSESSSSNSSKKHRRGKSRRGNKYKAEENVRVSTHKRAPSSTSNDSTSNGIVSSDDSSSETPLKTPTHGRAPSNSSNPTIGYPPVPQSSSSSEDSNGSFVAPPDAPPFDAPPMDAPFEAPPIDNLFETKESSSIPGAPSGAPRATPSNPRASNKKFEDELKGVSLKKAPKVASPASESKGMNNNMFEGKIIPQTTTTPSMTPTEIIPEDEWAIGNINTNTTSSVRSTPVTISAKKSVPAKTSNANSSAPRDPAPTPSTSSTTANPATAPTSPPESAEKSSGPSDSTAEHLAKGLARRKKAIKHDGTLKGPIPPVSTTPPPTNNAQPKRRVPVRPNTANGNSPAVAASSSSTTSTTSNDTEIGIN